MEIGYCSLMRLCRTNRDLSPNRIHVDNLQKKLFSMLRLNFFMSHIDLCAYQITSTYEVCRKPTNNFRYNGFTLSRRL